MKYILKGFYFIISIILCSCFSQRRDLEKINGVSYVASRDSISTHHVKPVLDIHANHAAIMPFGFISELSHPEIAFNTERQWFGERKVGVSQYVNILKDHGIKIMLKPQIWVRHGEFTGFINMENEENWKLLENSYSTFILEHAELAEELQIEMLCIGTELEAFVKELPEYWRRLIAEVKKVYKGKLTYAANWNEFQHTPFWTELDYIGVDAYFPVCDSQTPSVEECRTGWQTHKLELRAISETFKKPILFTEFGYRSVDYSGKEPWNSDWELQSINLEAQTNATQALFDEFWHEDWFAGGFVWKWFHAHDKVGGAEDNQFTPQNKPVEEIIKTYYLKY